MNCAHFATFTVTPDGTLAATGRVYSEPCSTGDSVVMTYGEYLAVVPQPSPITPAEVLYVVSWGFGVVLLGWGIGYVLGLVLGMIKKV